MVDRGREEEDRPVFGEAHHLLEDPTVSLDAASEFALRSRWENPHLLNLRELVGAQLDVGALKELVLYACEDAFFLQDRVGVLVAERDLVEPTLAVSRDETLGLFLADAAVRGRGEADERPGLLRLIKL